jgi:hypothetical protein
MVGLLRKKARTLPRAMGLIFQLDTKERGDEAENFGRVSGRCVTRADYLCKHRIF